MDPLQPVIIGSTRSKTVRELAVFTLLIGSSLLTTILTSKPLIEAIGVISIAIFCAFTLIAITLIFRKPMLTIDGTGLRWNSIRSWYIPWDDVGNFHVERADGTTIVVIDYRQDRWNSRPWSKRPPRILPGSLQISPDELVAILQARLEVHGEAMPVPTKRLLRPTVPEGWSVWGYSVAMTLAGLPGMILANGWVFPGTNVSGWVILGRTGIFLASAVTFFPIINWFLRRSSVRPSRPNE